MMPDISLKKLREDCPQGYNLATLVPLDQPSTDLTPLLEAVPVLKEASGALGVLRSMDIPGKRQGIQKQIALDGKEYKLWHLVFLPEPVDNVYATLHVYNFFLHRVTESEARHREET
jgi:hypothetical protein